MVLHQYLVHSDVVQHHYTRELLIHGVSASNEAGASAISKLKEACGFGPKDELKRKYTGLSFSPPMPRSED